MTGVRRLSTLLAGAAAGAFAATIFLRRRPTLAQERSDPRAQELREKLAEARNARADEADFEAAGMVAEAAVEEPAAPPPAPRRSPEEKSRPETPTPGGPADEFEAMRRRVHEEARAAAEEMRRDPGSEGG